MPIFVRVARGPVLSVRELDFVKAGRVARVPRSRLLVRHVLPNVTAPIVVQITLALSWAILTESALSFLGLGTQPPDPSLGLMVSEARTLVSRGWWLMAAPASAIVARRDRSQPARRRPARRLRPDPFDQPLGPPTSMDPADLAHLLTEQHRPELADLDLRSTAELVTLMADDHALAIAAIVAGGDRIAAAIDAVVDRLQRGGRLIYVGAGTAGRMGVLDAAECPPTFNTDRVVGVMAGSAAADAGVRGSRPRTTPTPAPPTWRRSPSPPHDAVVGIAASGRTPYMIGAVRHAAAAGR